ncbi:UDP-glucose--hexose-1-phosphate uridylyltransferase [Anaerosacchariphilus polymeriproducens]|uniref:Galactose-1-phosphate uridylyltransferase n=1 Tax=Anaerosacchariphilus polymeriproducens TaxID=1812858 RepID=A0A371AX09_9FIRM|nr:UDP-glucose--hexose-1-phosphate uridylyltransferase [Anaerosacchariphilus polymeriproducens]RDU24081.1 UDP-glucose--hexose-1-phosphate uridylyltransferase [Anaerosacchariphilus polymeriproducens]
MRLYIAIKKLVQYGLENQLISIEDKIYTQNRLLELFQEQEYQEPEEEYHNIDLPSVLDECIQIAYERKLIQDMGIVSRDLFDTKLMGCLTGRPSEIIKTFWDKYKISPKEATDFYYKFSQDTNYIRRDRIEKDIKWKVPSQYGQIEITINLSKPEKDPKAIAKALQMNKSTYPKCQLCMENEGYEGRLNHPARQNHRIIPITIKNDKWGFQYSPYVYYNEHCIVFNGEHVPMKINRDTFVKLFDFIKYFPHYFIGSNSDLPIVGGSILSHDHFQGGNHEFPMAKASIEKRYTIEKFSNVEVGILNWPLSVIRLRSKSEEELIELGNYILEKWKEYTDESAGIYASTNGERHNTITPIARKKKDMFELDLALRNNITTKEHPMGLYHPHEEIHHIKKENIGLIEVMGVAILPSRLRDEMKLLEEYIREDKDFSSHELLKKHAEWAQNILNKYPDIKSEDIQDILKSEIGRTFIIGLEHSGVFKCTHKGRGDFDRFMKFLK